MLPNTEVYTIFGNFPGCIWNGGGIQTSSIAQKETIEGIIKFYNDHLNLPLSFTFTNPLLNEKQYYDTYGNLIAELGNNGKNIILVSDIKFEEYLRKNYSNYKYCRSILATKNIPYSLKSKYGQYELSVLQRAKNNDWDFLLSIPEEHRSRIELLCNDPCPDNCPRLYTHYEDLAKVQIAYGQNNETVKCNMRHQFHSKYVCEHNKTYISRQMIDNQYLPNGFNKFKCAGRYSHLHIIRNLLKYIIKVEYMEDMYEELFHTIDIY